ncbi:MAG: low molecular weight phosphatase family protein [Clostridia bacterium]|nr:low molecular weight phosphatase family protein [Clostridia bacterium]
MSICPKSVLFVCTGNTCRSPMAQGLFQKMLDDSEHSSVTCRSAGLSAFDGEAASENSIEAMSEIGIDISAHRSKTVTRDLLSSTELIVCLSRGHYDVLRNFVDESRLRILGKGISDPYGMNLAAYIRTRDEINAALGELWEEFYG